jgi:hypothetical protein
MSPPILCQTHTRGWVNLAYARQIHFRKADDLNPTAQIVCIITWSNGNSEVFLGRDARAIIQFWRNYVQRLQE